MWPAVLQPSQTLSCSHWSCTQWCIGCQFSKPCSLALFLQGIGSWRGRGASVVLQILPAVPVASALASLPTPPGVCHPVSYLRTPQWFCCQGPSGCPCCLREHLKMPVLEIADWYPFPRVLQWAPMIGPLCSSLLHLRFRWMSSDLSLPLTSEDLAEKEPSGVSGSQSVRPGLLKQTGHEEPCGRMC